jgi:hypothetical protein
MSEIRAFDLGIIWQCRQGVTRVPRNTDRQTDRQTDARIPLPVSLCISCECVAILLHSWFLHPFLFPFAFFCHSVCPVFNGQSRWPRCLKAWVCGRWLAGITGSNPAGAWMSVYCECCAFSGRGLWSGWSLVQGSPTECVWLSVIRCNNNPLHLQWAVRRGQA